MWANSSKGYRAWKAGSTNFTTSYPIIERDNYNIYLVEESPCRTKDQLRAREAWYKINNECVNKVIAGRSRTQYKTDNVVQIKEFNALYRLDKKEKTDVSEALYRAKNKDKITENKSLSCWEQRKNSCVKCCENKDKIG